MAALLRVCLLALLIPLNACQQSATPPSLAPNELTAIAQLIYRNECGGKPHNLTSWNQGEQFASLGIGHFIWYPHGTPKSKRRFHESFPELLAFLIKQDIEPPVWLRHADGAPWPDRSHFLQQFDSAEMQGLRELLQSTMPLQARFMQLRMQRSLTLMQEGLPPREQSLLRRQFKRVAASPMGYYALIDYVNFKGEGTRVSERYQGKGWGLRQVLLTMHGEQEGIAAITAFADAARLLLEQRVALAPAERHEERWLPGWRHRLQTYVEEAKRLHHAAENSA